MKSTKYKHDPRKLCGNPAYHFGWENEGLPCWMCNKVEKENKADELTAASQSLALANQRIKELEEVIRFELGRTKDQEDESIRKMHQALPKEDSFK